MVLEFAAVSGCEFIVTYNVKDFRRVEELNVRAITPTEKMASVMTLDYLKSAAAKGGGFTQMVSVSEGPNASIQAAPSRQTSGQPRNQGLL